MSNLTWDMVRQMIAEFDLTTRPWAPLIGLIKLQESEYCDEDAVFVVSPPLSDMSDFVLCRSADKLMAAFPHMSRDEIAAYVYWRARNR